MLSVLSVFPSLGHGSDDLPQTSRHFRPLGTSLDSLLLEYDAMNIHAQFQGLETGGRVQRDNATIMNMNRDDFGYTHTCDFSGPIDAPETMPAGSVKNTECRNWRGRPIISQSEFTR